ncbi:histidine kinase [Actinoplanes sp. NPDC051851]|uniref:sensor histidine kinase n=1 Tax=Actinoplanes sp. NPDC051851 TaxID=3154753 RepID=UPI00341E60CC
MFLRDAVRRWHRLGEPVRDGLLAVVLAAISFLPALQHHGTQLGDLPPRPVDAFAVVASLAMSLPLVVRRRWPAWCLTVVAAGFALQELGGHSSFASVGLLVAIFSAGAHQPSSRRWWGLGATVAYAGLAAALIASGSPNGPADMAVFYGALAADWLLGAWLRKTRADEAENRRLTAESARTDERVKIARELHDVVTHHVTAMVVQAGAAQFLTAQPERVLESLESINDTGRRALSELRDLLGVLDPSRDAPMGRLPSLSQLDELVGQTRDAGQPIDLVRQGSPRELGAARELAAFRVVQESLTNALKYAAGSDTRVEVDYRREGLRLEIVTAKAAGPSPGTGGSGRGLAGLRERVEVFGGEFSAGVQANGGFAVRAHIPVADHP